MKLFFFDMEFANGKVPGSIYSIGFVQTNEKFKTLLPQTDLVMNPDCKFNDYVKANILAYSMKTIEAAPLFPAHYKRMKKLLKSSGLIVGFAVSNDTNALRKACIRYRLPLIRYGCLDLEKLCKKFADYPEAHGLDGLVRAYCGIEPANRHRSDADAYATMLLLQKLCEVHGLVPKTLKKLYADCFVEG